jgi:hypothetical protein
MTTRLDEAFFRSLVDFDAVEARVRTRLALLRGGADVVRFFVHYASWNGCFANGVSALTSLVGSRRELFREPGYARALADRSNFVASFFFDAARDEYDDHINPLRDSHRCMAQASLIGMQGYFKLGDEIFNEAEPADLDAVNEGVMVGYTGGKTAGGNTAGEKAASGNSAGDDAVTQVFSAMGYHLGSELLADREFSLIDEYLREHQYGLVQHLMRTTVPLAGGTHRCYAWVGVHSGHGGGVEADHFDRAAEGACSGLQYLAAGSASQAVDALVGGFRAFDRDHARFFAIRAG